LEYEYAINFRLKKIQKLFGFDIYFLKPEVLPWWQIEKNFQF